VIEPYLDDSGTLVISDDCDPRYRWWDGGIEVMETLWELAAPPEVVDQYKSPHTEWKRGQIKKGT